MSQPLFQLKDVHAGYGDVKILNGVNISVPTNSIVTIVGPNGAGKSTILKSVYQIARVTEGEIILNGKNGQVDVTAIKPHKLVNVGIGYVPQIDNIFPALTIEENLDVGFIHGEGRDLETRKSEMFKRYPDLAPRHKERAGSLSGGQRQMLALARSLMSYPELLLLDEPSAGLAPALVDQLFEELVSINESGVTILMVEQNARRALEISTYGYVLDMGKNRHEGDGRQLAVDPEIVGIYFGKK